MTDLGHLDTCSNLFCSEKVEFRGIFSQLSRYRIVGETACVMTDLCMNLPMHSLVLSSVLYSNTSCLGYLTALLSWTSLLILKYYCMTFGLWYEISSSLNNTPSKAVQNTTKCSMKTQKNNCKSTFIIWEAEGKGCCIPHNPFTRIGRVKQDSHKSF